MMNGDASAASVRVLTRHAPAQAASSPVFTGVVSCLPDTRRVLLTRDFFFFRTSVAKVVLFQVCSNFSGLRSGSGRTRPPFGLRLKRDLRNVTAYTNICSYDLVCDRTTRKAGAPFAAPPSADPLQPKRCAHRVSARLHGRPLLRLVPHRGAQTTNRLTGPPLDNKDQVRTSGTLRQLRLDSDRRYVGSRDANRPEQAIPDPVLITGYL
jgi:hypothetical protein